jgi:hypothetical protein
MIPCGFSSMFFSSISIKTYYYKHAKITKNIESSKPKTKAAPLQNEGLNPIFVEYGNKDI